MTTTAKQKKIGKAVTRDLIPHLEGMITWCTETRQPLALTASFVDALTKAKRISDEVSGGNK